MSETGAGGIILVACGLSRSFTGVEGLDGVGLAVVRVSSELPEGLAVFDRNIIMYERRATLEFTSAKATEEAIMHAALPRKSGPSC